MIKMKNLVAYITGGASGIGKAIAERIVALGGRVCIVDNNPDGANIIKTMGDKATFCLTDITQECDVLDSLNHTKEYFGKIDVVINSAGILKTGNIYDFKSEVPHCEDSFKVLWDVNVWGTFNVIRLAAGIIAKNPPNENKERGIIINLASIMAFDAPSNFVAYGATKAAIAGMTIPLARGLSSKGIRVVSVCPGFTDTPLINYISDEDKKKIFSDMLVPKRFGSCDEVSHLIQAIIENPVINGETIRIDSGWRYSQVNDSIDDTITDNC